MLYKNSLSALALLLSCVCEAQISNPNHAQDRVEIQCGSHRIAIACGRAKPGDPADERVCVRNTLSFTNSEGAVFSPKQPKAFRQEFVVEKTATSIRCGDGKANKAYVLVDFVAGALGCGPCSTMDIFSEDGKRLTINSRNLDRLIREQNIRWGKAVYIERYGE